MLNYQRVVWSPCSLWHGFDNSRFHSPKWQPFAQQKGQGAILTCQCRDPVKRWKTCHHQWLWVKMGLIYGSIFFWWKSPTNKFRETPFSSKKHDTNLGGRTVKELQFFSMWSLTRCTSCVSKALVSLRHHGIRCLMMCAFNMFDSAIRVFQNGAQPQKMVFVTGEIWLSVANPNFCSLQCGWNSHKPSHFWWFRPPIKIIKRVIWGWFMVF